METALDQTPALCAGRFTAADISVGYALRLAENIGLTAEFGPNVAAYWQRLQQREAYRRAVAAENAAAARLNYSPDNRAGALFDFGGCLNRRPCRTQRNDVDAAKIEVAPRDPRIAIFGPIDPKIPLVAFVFGVELDVDTGAVGNVSSSSLSDQLLSPGLLRDKTLNE